MESTNSIPQELGDFEIIRELGRGGMGIVYEARQKSLNRRVALKVLSSGLGLTAKAVMRFRREAEAAAKLHHTNIVPIYSTGEDRGVHYYAMELVDGPSLDQVIRHMREAGEPESTVDDAEESDVSESSEHLPDWVDETIAFEGQTPGNSSQSTAAEGLSGSTVASGTKYYDTVASMMADVADALDHGHEQGVIHRDIKPSNLLLGPDGRLSINDFGLARVLEQPGMTMSGEFVGSPLYMSPEQITAGRAPLDHRTDVYSLGATLYELLTLRPPFPGNTRDQVIAQILHKEHKLPRTINHSVPRDLEAICVKSLERDPDRRYLSAGHMAEDLRRFVNRHAVSAKRIGPIDRTVKWIRRNSVVATLAGLLLLFAGMTGALAYRIHLVRAEEQKQANLARLEKLEQLKEDAFVSALSTDFTRASMIAEDAKRLGASDGWIHLIKGQIATLDGRYEEGRVELEQALRTIENSTGAYALLALAYLYSGDEVEYFNRVRRLPNDSTAFHDLLFKGWAETYWRPQLGKLHLKQACDQRTKSHLARLLYAIALVEVAAEASDTNKSLREANEAIQELDVVRSYLPDIPIAVSQNVLAGIVAANAYKDLGDSDESRRCLENVRGDADRLRTDFPDNVLAAFARTHFLFHTGQETRILQELEEDLRDPAKAERITTYRAVYGACLYARRRNFSQAQEVIESVQGSMRPFVQFAGAFSQLLGSTGEDDRSKIADAYAASLKGAPESGAYLNLHWYVLRLLREDEKLDDIARGFRQGRAREDWEHIGAYMLRELEPDQLIEACHEPRSAKGYAHFTLGIDLLARGHRDEAADHFKAVVDNHYFNHYAYWWSQAFLDRIDDPEWLPWLPNTEEQAK